MMYLLLFVFIVFFFILAIYTFTKAYEAAQDDIPVGYIGFTVLAIAVLWVIVYGIKWDVVFASFCNLSQ